MHNRVYKTASPQIVAWPSPQDYNEAVQNIASSFRDPKLKTGEAELSAIGLPKPISGAFASVYKISAAQKNYAVRCFLSNRLGQQERYRKISKHLNSLRLDYMVPFEYQDEGLRIQGRNYPLLVMEWVEGTHLDQYIEQHLSDPRRLEQLSEKWLTLLRGLHENGIAHGDLQHGNIIISDDEFKLVDYDGMYVPSLEGELSTELGHRNYQHPLRSKMKFGPGLDNFSAWSIYASLYCLSRDPQLWRMLRGGDECLLFRQDDYAAPSASDTFLLLEKNENEEIREMSRLLRTLLLLPYDEIPDLGSPPPISDDLPEAIGLAATKAAEAAAKAAALAARRQDSDHHQYSWDRADSGHKYSWDRDESDADKRWDQFSASHILKPTVNFSSNFGGGSSGGSSGTKFRDSPSLILYALIIAAVVFYIGFGVVKLINGSTAVRHAASAVEAMKKQIPPTPAETAYNGGIDSFRGGLYEEAIASFDKAIELDPNSEKNFYSRAATFQMLKKYRSAMADYTKAISLDQYDWRPYFYRGICNWYYGYLDRALPDLNKAEELSKSTEYGQIDKDQQWSIKRLGMDRNQHPWSSELKVAL